MGRLARARSERPLLCPTHQWDGDRVGDSLGDEIAGGATVALTAFRHHKCVVYMCSVAR